MNAIIAWFKEKGGVSHVFAGAFASLMLAYAVVPPFKQSVNHIHAMLPGWAQELATSALALYAWYRNNSKPTQEKP